MTNLSLFRPASLKVMRAHRQIAQIEEEVADAVAACDHTLVVVNKDNWETWFRSPVTADQAAFIATLVGSTLHSLRSALDTAAVAAVTLNGKDPKKVHFPSGKDETEFAKQIKEKNFNRAGDECVQLVRELKPFGGAGGNVELYALHTMNITDKHRTLLSLRQLVLAPAMQLQMPDGAVFVYAQNRYSAPAGHEPAGKIMGIPLAITWDQDGYPEEDQYDRVELEFDDDHPLGGRAVVRSLEELCDLVDSIIERFTAIFRQRL